MVIMFFTLVVCCIADVLSIKFGPSSAQTAMSILCCLWP